MFQYPNTEAAFSTDMTRASALREALTRTPLTHPLYYKLQRDIDAHEHRRIMNQTSPHDWRGRLDEDVDRIGPKIRNIIAKWHELYENPLDYNKKQELIECNHECLLAIVRHEEALEPEHYERHTANLIAADTNEHRLNAEHNERVNFYRHLLDTDPERYPHPPVYTWDHDYEIEAHLKENEYKRLENERARFPDPDLRVKLEHEKSVYTRFKHISNVPREHWARQLNDQEFEIKLSNIVHHWRQLQLTPLDSVLQHELMILNHELLTAIVLKAQHDQANGYVHRVPI